jgi:hypothetical protein
MWNVDSKSVTKLLTTRWNVDSKSVTKLLTTMWNVDSKSVTKLLTTMFQKTLRVLIFLYLHFKDNFWGNLSESSKTVFITFNKTTLFCAFFACFVSWSIKQILMKVYTICAQKFNPISVKFSPTLRNAQTEIIKFLQTADSATNSYIT